MKRIKDLRENYNLITEKEEHDMNKLTQLVRAGLFDAKKISALKRAMEKPADKMTAQEKRMMINLLDALMSEVLSDKQVYRKIKQDVMKEETKDYYAKPDPRVNRGWPNAKDIPSVLLLKRKAIRVFPDGEKVALYYAQAIDKYVSIPFSEIGINEELNEGIFGNIIAGVKSAVSRALSSNNSSSSASSDSKSDVDPIAKELKPLDREKSKLNVSSDFKGREPYRTAVDANTERLSRKASAEMAKGVRENFKSKLQALNEDDIDSYEGRMGFLYGYGGGSYVPYGGGAFGGAPRTKSLGSSAVAVKAKPAVPRPFVPKRRSPIETPDRRRRDVPASPRGPGRYNPSQPKPAPKKAPPKEEPKTTPIEQPAAPKPVVQPKPQRVSPPKVTPNVKPPAITPATPIVQPAAPTAPKKSPTTPAREAPSYKPKPAARPEFPGSLPAAKPSSKPAPGAKPSDKPDVAPTQQPASQPAALAQPRNRPWEKADQWKETKPPKRDQRKKDGKEKTKRRFTLPIPGISDPGAKLISPRTGGLKLTISGPKKEGDADALRSRMSSIERKALKSQASMTESVELNLDGNQFVLNNKEANKVLSLYESLNTKNKKKMIKMMSEGEEQFNKIISFAVRQ